jgi:hypothetical protein
MIPCAGELNIVRPAGDVAGNISTDPRFISEQLFSLNVDRMTRSG